MPTLARPYRLLLAAALLAAAPAIAQQPPPAVGVAKAILKPVTPTTEFVGRVQSVERVNLVARVTAYLDKRLFTEGAEVKKGDLLYRLEQGPFQADVQAKQATIAQFTAQLQNASITLTRQKTLLSSPAGQQAAVDLALANQQALQAQILGARAQLRQAEISLDYTEIRAPIDGKIGRTAVTVGNVVGPNTGVLATIVSQDPMYVVFPVPARTAMDLRQRYASAAGFDAVVKIRLPNGELYGQTGHLDFFDNTVAGNTDTITLRGVMPNPVLPDIKDVNEVSRGLVDGALITVLIEDAKPLQALTIPRAAVLTDQSGDFVYLVDAQDKVLQQRVRLGQSSPTAAVVTEGLREGDAVVVDGIQRVRPGQVVAPSPVEAPPGAAPSRS